MLALRPPALLALALRLVALGAHPQGVEHGEEPHLLGEGGGRHDDPAEDLVLLRVVVALHPEGEGEGQDGGAELLAPHRRQHHGHHLDEGGAEHDLELGDLRGLVVRVGGAGGGLRRHRRLRGGVGKGQSFARTRIGPYERGMGCSQAILYLVMRALWKVTFPKDRVSTGSQG